MKIELQYNKETCIYSILVDDKVIKTFDDRSDDYAYINASRYVAELREAEAAKAREMKYASILGSLLSSSTPKTDREHVAVREIKRLQDELKALKEAHSFAITVLNDYRAEIDFLRSNLESQP